MKPALLALGLTLVSQAASATTCYFEVDRTILLQGACDFEFTGNGGFEIYGPDPNPRGEAYFREVIRFDLTGNGLGTAVFTGGEGSHLHGMLRNLDRQGACWTNDQGSLCAWAE
ncbi:hypothetical protein [Limimaricola litoreus]|uniref:Uncharacterized protein n=1 Tax=Limimaricola litoreus TaxID=2955316 RepID=A0A9X2FXE8_9RHOB|nr:hypothetical protein [Limimaricola litoreus]MCP1168918.1 hypothetical protein [Limimaricola litoreus]